MQTQLKYALLFLAVTIPSVTRCAVSQQAGSQPAAGSVKLPEFEAATIKPSTESILGFYGRSGGRVILGSATVKMLIYYAFNVQEFQISGGPDWSNKERYDVEAIPPDNSESRKIRTAGFIAEPTGEQRQMLQNLLLARFSLKYHKAVTEGPVYILTRGKGKLQLHEPKDKDSDPRAIVRLKPGEIVDGSAFGNNTTMSYLATMLSGRLHRPVLDQTGIQGTYDFDIPPSDPTNQDMAVGVMSAMQQLGLKLEQGKGAIETIVIDSVERPTPN